MKNPNSCEVGVFPVSFTNTVNTTVNATVAPSQSTEIIRTYPILAKHWGFSDAVKETTI